MVVVAAVAVVGVVVVGGGGGGGGGGGYLSVAVAGTRQRVFRDAGQEHGVGKAVRHVEVGADGAAHAVDEGDGSVGECDARLR